MHCDTTFKLRISIACLTNLRQAKAKARKEDDPDMILMLLSSEMDPAEIMLIQ
jgi:hypothetical protein